LFSPVFPRKWEHNILQEAITISFNFSFTISLLFKSIQHVELTMHVRVKFIVSVCPSQSVSWKLMMIAAKGKHKMCLLQRGKMRNTVKCIVPGTGN